MGSKKKLKNKTSDITYEVKLDKSSGIQEQLGIYIYPEQEKRVSTLEIKKSEHPKVSKFNDIDLNRWKDYNDIITDSLWLFGSRDKSGAHTAELHGNFIPQIPHQAILRYTKRGEIQIYFSAWRNLNAGDDSSLWHPFIKIKMECNDSVIASKKE